MHHDRPSPHRPPAWQRRWLLAAGVYNLAWGAINGLFPGLLFGVLGMEAPRELWAWQCVAMIVGVYGVGYLCAARDPWRHWPIVLVGLLGKVLGPIGYVVTAARGDVAWNLGATILTNDLIWWIPFAWILWDAAKHAQRGTLDESSPVLSPREAMEGAVVAGGAGAGRTLSDLSREAPQLVVFLRHAGCTFCREAMAELRDHRAEIERSGARIVIVHMSSEARAKEFAEAYAMGDLSRIADPQRTLYRAFELGRGTLWQLFGPAVWWRGFIAGVLRGHGVGKLEGDGFQMPGTFLVREDEIVRAARARSAADRPDYAQMACELT